MGTEGLLDTGLPEDEGGCSECRHCSIECGRQVVLDTGTPAPNATAARARRNRNMKIATPSYAFFDSVRSLGWSGPPGVHIACACWVTIVFECSRFCDLSSGRVSASSRLPVAVKP